MTISILMKLNEYMGQRKSETIPYLFMAPFLIVFIIFLAYPLVQSVVLSMQQTYGPKTTKFVFFDNFSFLIRDPLFWKAMLNTCLFAAGSLLTQLPVSLGLAMLLNRPRLRGRVFFRLVFFSPSLVGLVFVALLFGPIFEKNTGLLNIWLHRLFGFNLEFPWTERYVVGGLILAAFWMYIGLNMIYFLAALQNVDPNLVEAAMLDGASAWDRFWHITIPAIRPVASFVALLSLIGSFQLYDLPYVLLNSGAGPNNEGLTVVMYLYQTGFEMGDLGYACAIGWLLAALLIVLAIGQRLIMKRYED